MNNYDFCAQWIIDKKTENNVRVLDYGCGAGQIVKKLRERGVNAFGCDVFYEGGDCSKDIDPTLFGSAIRRMEKKEEEEYTIPFDSASFDFVINNQVMEHVEDLDSVLSEIQRVLKPGGMILSIFPHKGGWREGHCGIPFLHRFPKGTNTRVYYAAACRAFGLGYTKGDKSIMLRSQESCEWLDKWTYYRTQEEIHSAYDKYFVDLQHIEDYWLRQRFGGFKMVAVGWLPVYAQKLVVRKLGDLVFTARKPSA